MKINIIRQDILKYRRVALVRRINALITFGSLGLFILAIVYMTSQFVYLGFRQNSLTKKAAALQTTYNTRSKEVAEYVAVKDVVATVADLDKKRFKYKEFLNGIFSLLPSAAILSSVDFGAPGVVVAGVRLPQLNDYDVLLANISGATSAAGFLFSAIAEKQLTRDTSGSYLAILELKIK